MKLKVNIHDNLAHYRFSLGKILQERKLIL